MKHIILIILSMAAALACRAGGKLDFGTVKADFGTVSAKGGQVTMEYPFTNTGDEPLSIVTVTNGGCGCTKPDFPVEPIRPGGKGVIKIHFNPSAFKGEVNRQVKVQSSASRKRVRLTFSGVVIP